MSDPARLADSTGDEPGAGLLRAARDYRLSEETRQRAFTAAGLTAVAPAPPIGKAAGAKGMELGTKMFGWSLAGVVGVGAAVGGYLALAPGHDVAPRSTPLAPSIWAPAPHVPSAAASQGPVEPPAGLLPGENAPPAPPAPSAPTMTSPRASSARLHVAAPTDLQAELAALDTVSNAVARGDVVRALALLDAYGRDFPRGSLLAEATVLRAEALEHAGRHSEAVRLARTFVGRYPKSPLTERMQQIAGD